MQLKKGTLIHTQIDNEKVDSFVLATRLKGRNPSYAITVIKQKRDGRKYYDHNIILKNKLETAEQIQNENTSEMLHPALKGLLQKIYSVNENSVSKVVDENGEPLVVYHGSNHWFNIFNEGKTNKTNVNTPENTIFTNDNKEIASSFCNYYGGAIRDVILDKDSPLHRKYDWGTYREGGVYSLFMNLRNPKILDYPNSPSVFGR